MLGIASIHTDFFLATPAGILGREGDSLTLLLAHHQQETPPGTPIPGAVWLFGTVLAGGAGYGRWRKKRKAQLAPA